VISIYFGTDKKNLEKSIQLAYKEFDKLKKTRLGSLQLYKAKRQMIGQLARSAESHEILMLSMAKSYLIYNKVDGLTELSKKVNALTSGELLEIANDVLDFDKLSTLIYT
ncbi:MAG: insulinase family protein, partial [Bacteroidales bacterium]